MKKLSGRRCHRAVEIQARRDLRACRGFVARLDGLHEAQFRL